MDRPRLCPTHRSRRQAGCDECRRNLRERRNWYRYGTITPPPTLQPAEPVRTHIRSLLDAGMRLADIAADAGTMAVGQLSSVMYTNRPTVTRHTAARILAVQPRPADGWLIDGTGTRRRVRALAVVGWHLGELAQRIGYDASVGSKWAHVERLGRTTRDKVAALYDEVWTLDGGSVRTARRAARNGWHPPEAWSEQTIDDPAAEPYDWCRELVDEVALEQVAAGLRRFCDLTPAEKVEILRRHWGSVSQNQMVEVWRLDRRTLRSYAADLGLAA